MLMALMCYLQNLHVEVVWHKIQRTSQHGATGFYLKNNEHLMFVSLYIIICNNIELISSCRNLESKVNKCTPSK